MRRDALRSYAEAVRLAPEATMFRRQYAILLADTGRREEALRQFREVVRILEARAQDDEATEGNTSGATQGEARRREQRDAGGDGERPARPVGSTFRLPPAQERELWQQLYGPQPSPPAEFKRLEPRLRALRLGWFEHLVRRAVYRRMGLAQQAEAASAAARREAAAQVLALTVLP
jgi:hypothetical protein